MKKSYLFLMVGLLCLPEGAFSSKKKAVDPRVRDVRTIFIKGNNEAAVKARQNLANWTCFGLASGPGQADATLDFSQQQSVSGALISGNRERSIVSAELTTKGGDVIWSGNATRDAGIVNTGAGSAAIHLLSLLQADAFPEVKTGFRGPDRSACPAVSAPPAAAPEPAANGAAAPPAEPGEPATTGTKKIRLGMTTDQVEKALGPPATRADLGEKVLYKYKDMTVEFHDGKVTDVR